jgi:hypothetical protein
MDVCDEKKVGGKDMIYLIHAFYMSILVSYILSYGELLNPISRAGDGSVYNFDYVGNPIGSQLSHSGIESLTDEAQKQAWKEIFNKFLGVFELTTFNEDTKLLDIQDIQKVMEYYTDNGQFHISEVLTKQLELIESVVDSEGRKVCWI